LWPGLCSLSRPAYSRERALKRSKVRALGNFGTSTSKLLFPAQVRFRNRPRKTCAIDAAPWRPTGVARKGVAAAASSSRAKLKQAGRPESVRRAELLSGFSRLRSDVFVKESFPCPSESGFSFLANIVGRSTPEYSRVRNCPMLNTGKTNSEEAARDSILVFEGHLGFGVVDLLDLRLFRCCSCC